MPSLEWEENVFLGLKALYNSLVTSPKERAIQARQAKLIDFKSRLLLLAKILSKRNVSIFETDDPVLYLNDRICLPTKMFLAGSVEANRECYLLRTVVAAVAIRNGCLADRATLQQVLDICEEELLEFVPRLNVLLAEVELEELIPRLPTLAECPQIQNTFLEEACLDEQAESTIVTELEGKGKVNIVEVKEGETGEQDTPFHTFEKAETLEEYNGLSRQNDAEDELLDHSEALSKLEMDSILRTTDRSQSVYKADIMLDGIGFELRESNLVGIPYPEWNYKHKAYRRDWCYVQQSIIDQVDQEWINEMCKKHFSLIRTLKKKFSSIATEWLQIKRQISGDEVDLDAAVELLVRLRTKEPPPEYLYIGANRVLPDVATMILVDTSYSTDSWVENRCVLDIMKETVFCIAEVLDEADKQLSIYGFSSNTRQSCSVRSVKQFSEDWMKVRGRLGGLNSIGYTRIGPALRHAYGEFSKISAEKKLLILLTDGKPCDYDHYEGRYGIEDVRKAIQEGKSEGILTHAFAVDKQARDYFPIMFTKSNFDIVSHPSKLLESLFKLYLKLAVGR